ncbi:MAG: C39 family peptidase [Treponema sp.]|nr:C39 family peptidase [Treponema sp.]
MSEKNNSEGKPYYTQRNNELAPNGACNVTSIIAALSAAGWPVKQLADEKYKQPEDALMSFIRSDGEANALWRKLDPAGRHAPNEWHAVLAYGANKFLRVKGLLTGSKTAVEFGENWSVASIAKAIDDGGAFVASGVFVAEGKKTIGHVVAVVGVERADDGSIEKFIIDDSWGDYRTEYADRNGNDVEMPMSDFIKTLRPCGFQIKLGHRVNMFKEC